MSKSVSNVDDMIVPALVGVPGTISARLAAWRDEHGACDADLSEFRSALGDCLPRDPSITQIELCNPCAAYSEVSLTVGQDVVHARLIEPQGQCRPADAVPLCLMFHDIDRPVRGWHHMTRFAAMGYAVLALDDEPVSMDDLADGVDAPAFVERVRAGLALAQVARDLPGIDAARVFAWGEGLGGGVALAVAALDKQGLACTALDNPLPAGLEALSPAVRGSVLLGTSLMDTQSNPRGQFAVFNGLGCDRRHIVYAKYTHERINAFENEVLDFFNQTFYPCR